MVQPAAPVSNPGSNNPFYQAAGQAAGGSTPAGSTTPTAGTTTTGSSTEAPPSAAQSSYQYQNYVAPVSVSLGPQMAEMLGLNANTQYHGDDIIRQFEQLPPSALIQLESLLYSAGFYASVAGEPLGSRVPLGGTSNDDFAALSAAILKVGNSGLSLTQVINNQITSGQGYLAQQGALQPVTGGGNTYQIKKTSPDDIYATAMSTFQQYLGRNPTQQEINAMVAGYNQLETNYQTTLNTQTENESQAQYASKLAQRQAQMTPAQPPANGSGQVANGPFTSPTQYAVAVLEQMGGTPNANNIALLTTWINANGGLHGKGQFNPLGVGATSQGSTGAGAATNYTNWAEGIMNAVDLLDSPQYGDLRLTLMSGSTSTLSAAASSELSQWSNGAVTSLKPTKTVLNQAAQAVKTYIPQQQTQPAAANPALSSPPTYTGVWNPNASPTPMPMQSPQNLPPQMTAQGQAPIEGGGDNSEPTLNKSQMVGRPNQFAPTQAAPAATPGTPYSSTFTPVTAVGQGQGMTSPGDTYLPSSTATLNQPPSLSGYATTQATTGANQLPYMTNQYLQAYQSILGMIKAEF